MATYPYSLQAPEDDENYTLQVDPATGQIVRVPASAAPMQQDPYGNPYMPAAPVAAPAPAPYLNPYSNITPTDDPMEAAKQDRSFAYAGGENLRRDLTQAQQDAANDIRFANEYAFNLHDPLAQGRGGIPQSELEQILQKEQWQNLQMTPEEMAEAGLTPEEVQAMQGNTSDYFKWFNPNQEFSTFDETQGFRRGAVDQFGNDLRGAYDPNRLRAPGEFYGALAGARDEFSGKAREILDPSELNVSPEFLQKYQLTPEQQQDIITGAGISTGTRYKAAADDLSRQARAAGMDPAGTAVMRGRLERSSAADAGDAITQARIGANREAAERLKTGEGMRLDYGQRLAGMRTAAEQAIADSAFRTAMAAEDVRGAQERDIADRGTFAAREAGLQKIKSEADLARERQNLLKDVSVRGTDIQMAQDVANANRARDIALNRQGTKRYTQGERYGRGKTALENEAAKRIWGAEARRADEREGRGYARSFAERQNQNWQAAQNRPLQLYGQQVAAGQGATRTQGQLYDAEQGRPSWWERVLGTGLGVAGSFGGPVGRVARGAAGGFGGGRAKGGVITKPTYAILGEEGPEIVISLTASPNDAVVAPGAIRMGKPKPFDTSPPRIKPAYAQQYRYGK